MNIRKELEVISRTGKVALGFRQSYLSLLNGKSKLVLLAKNCPSNVEKRIYMASRMVGVPMIKTELSSNEIGYIVGKPFRVSTLSVLDPGSSNILEEVAPEVE
ncbi:MAG: 50S ribosomal protein L30e [Candidatus Terraquivivens tikiterensis]|uniref:50S ribosomal protein L30e n=1 Tax=Candidatus Terraquivivens tikiterensis TaxID=1980982 RepID=A0A2R7Y2D7_9ARCH|nr:MAG: 50S ribosomal protein L30e [Candidatus Terraquivivens tikiterensis]